MTTHKEKIFALIRETHPTAAAFCRDMGYSAQKFSRICGNNPEDHFDERGAFRPAVHEVASLLCVAPEDIFGSCSRVSFEHGVTEDMAVSAPAQFETALSHEQRQKIKFLLSRMNPRRAFVLRKLFGIEQNSDYTPAEVAEMLKVPPNRIRQLCQLALHELRCELDLPWLSELRDLLQPRDTHL